MKLTKKLSNFNDRHNLWLKVLAVVISVLIWLVVVNVSDPVTSTTLTGVSVEITNGDVLTSQGKIYEITSAETTSVTVSAKRSILDSIGKDNLKAVADMNDLDEATGTIPLKVESNKYGEKIESMKAKESSVQISVDNLMKSQLPITASVTGTPAENYVIGDVTMDQNIVRISGLEKIISQVAKVVAEVSVEGMSSNISTAVELKLYDKDNNQIEDDNVTKNISSVAIVAEVLATKEVSVKAYTSGTVADGYGLTGKTSINPETVMIAGKASVLKNISEITIPSTELSVEGAMENVKATLDLSDYLPENTRFAVSDQDTTVSVTVGVGAKKTETEEISRGMITVKNVPTGFSATVSLTRVMEIELTGMPDAMAKLEESPMEVTIDLEAYMKEMGITALGDEATYEVPLTLKLPSGVQTLEGDDIYVSLKIEKKTE